MYNDSDEGYVRDYDEDNPGMDSNHEYNEPYAPHGDDSGDYLDRMDSELKGCFIATAAWGSPMAEQVILLQDFRDKYLIKNTYGRAFIRNYYRFSPTIAGYIQNRELLKRMVRSALAPVIYIVATFTAKN